MHEIEIRAKSIDEARKIAAFQLGVSEDEVEVEVISGPDTDPSLQEYLVRARLRPDAFSPHGQEEEREEVPEEQPIDIDVSQFSLSAATPEPTGEEPVEEEIEEEPLEDLSSQRQVGERACEFLRGLAEVLGVKVDASIVYVGSDEVRVDLHGEDVAFFIGRYGSTLDAVQLLAAVAANKGAEHGARVVLDAEGYRERRRASLEKLARSTAAKVKRSGEPIAIPNLKPYERRIVHMTLRDDPDVETYSEGEGSRRRLIVAPRRCGHGR